jgi:DNA-binding beta-propeller fold protein YncE
MQSRRRIAASITLAVALAAAATFTQVSSAREPGASDPRLVAFDPTPGDGEWCEMGPDLSVLQARPELAAFQRPSAAARPAANVADPPGGPAPACSQEGCEGVAARQPIRFIQDPYAEFSGVNVDNIHNEVILNDENRFNVLVYDRTTNTPASAEKAAPKRSIGGPRTQLQLSSNTWVDPKNGDIYVINNDSLRGLFVFGREQQGDIQAKRKLIAPYGSYGLAMDDAKGEMFLTIQHDGAITTWSKQAQGNDHPIRLIQGDKTHLGDPHGIAHDAKNNLLYVVNYGTTRKTMPGTLGAAQRNDLPRIPNWPSGNLFINPADQNEGYRFEIVKGSGHFGPPSVTVFPADAQGNVAPLRIIEGPKAQLDWPTGVAVDPDHNELFVANAVGDTVNVYSTSANGDVAPIRVLKGPKSMVKNPTGLAMDAVNDELWVANFGNHVAAAFKRTAVGGDQAPVRVVRSAPIGAGSSLFSNPFSIVYDLRRDQLIVPNCVGQPRIAMFDVNANKNAEPVRKVEGSKTNLNRTVHSVDYDPIHDEIYVQSNIGQAILVFRGGASGEEPPIRIIQGPKTQLRDPEKVAVDPVNDEIIVFEMTQHDKVMFFDRKANGDVAPKRILQGPDTMLKYHVGAATGAIDPVHNLLIVGARIDGVGPRMLIYDRTAEGNAKPKAIIGGPKSGLRGVGTIRVYPPTGRIIVNVAAGGDDNLNGSYTGVWNITDNGDVPPQWAIGKGMLKQIRGVTINPKNKTIVISDKYLAGVLTYSLPEMF